MLTEFEKANFLLETYEGIFRLPDEAHANLGITESAETFATEEQIVAKLSTLHHFKAPSPDGTPGDRSVIGGTICSLCHAALRCPTE